jgi:hypothetical protein
MGTACGRMPQSRGRLERRTKVRSPRAEGKGGPVTETVRSRGHGTKKADPFRDPPLGKLVWWGP